MIFGNTESLSQALLPAALQHLLSRPELSLEALRAQADGLYELEGKQLFYMLSTNDTKPAAEMRSEFHQQYLDIQLLLRGEEWIGVGPHSYVNDGADHPHPDLWFVDDDQTSYLALQPGDFAIFWPGELHRPLCTLTTPGLVKKLVVKVHQSLLATV